MVPLSYRAVVRLNLFLIVTVAGVLVWSPPARAADPLDWPNWRGPQQDNVSTETGLVDKWNPSGGPGSNVLWKRPDLGSISTPIVMRGKLYTLCRYEPNTRREGERVVCVDAATGKDLWQHVFNVYLTDVPDSRVGWSSCVGDPKTGRVYAQGVSGYFVCLDGETGKPIWSHSLGEEFGVLSTFGGRTNVPVVFENLVLISGVVIGWGDMAKPTHRFLAFDKNTGQVVWFNGTRPLPEDTTYSTPALCVLGGQQALVFGSGDGGVWAFQTRTGVPIWSYQASKRGINTSPTVMGDIVYIGHSEENMGDRTMGNFLAINGTAHGKPMPGGGEDISKDGAIWQNRGCNIGKSSPVPVGEDRLVAVDDSAKMFVFDRKTGEEVTRKTLGTLMRSTPLVADGKIYTCTADGRWYTLRLVHDRLQEVQRFRLPGSDESHGSPICSHGRIYVPTTGALYCLADESKKPGSAPMPLSPAEKQIDNGNSPTHIQIVPAEVLLSPGAKQKFTVNYFNANGQNTGDAFSKKPGKFKLDGPGTINSEGDFEAEYTAPGGNKPTAAILHFAKDFGDIGTARIRIVPPLPWKFDFSNGQVPITWVGCRYRHIIRELDGKKVMVKITTIPKGTRSQGWMGPIDLHDYTIQADVRGSIKDHKRPDIGLTAQRYTIDLMGEAQKLQIRTWPAVLERRMGKTIDFAWKPDTWYTMKLRVSVKDGKGLVQGKVWPRGEAEPAAWTIEADDVAPNLMGSPGLYANATNAEVFYDNLTVTPNE